ncbi:ABC transporter permease [Streptomyces benahoarensis]|uniref:FtsX-like permease family protein n=1 Tax=Streptomyces benahoarensis TaxID=2595054 RepID=A0A553ZQQ9_9ACTN|nr:FtsX-like permease family protein [Streptomyces benahoarensis]TSB32295.1 FtsX-like permease family protein [Streptomyces benahoarensis]TSB43800.1 FtsX-like permease family protein [Streptomyces benahoarensis]
MLRTAVRNLFAHKARLMMTVLAVLLGVAFVSGTLVFSDTVGNALKNASAKNLDDVAVSVQAESEPPKADDRRTTVLTDKTAAKVRAVPGVRAVRADITGDAVLAAKDGKPVGEAWQNLAANYQPGPDGKDGRYPLVRGRGPAAAGEIAMAEATARKAGYRIGDTVRFATNGPVLAKKLVGLVATDDPKVTAGGSLVLLDTATAQRLYLHPGQFDELVVSAAPGADEAALTREVRAAVPGKGATVTSGTALAEEQSVLLAEQNKALTSTLLTFAGIALFVGIFIIANTFTMLISQRRREIALLRAVGASRRQVVRSVLIEATLLGVVASVVGMGLGVGIATGIRAVLNANNAGLPDGPLVISPVTVLASLATGTVVTVLAAWLPSRRAAKIAPVEALSTVDTQAAPRSLVLRNIFGAVVGGAGVAVMFWASTLESSDDLPIAMLGSALTMIGVIVLAPLLSRPLVFLTGAVTGRLFGTVGKLAKENALRNPRRTAATGSALMIGLTLITGMTVVGHSAQSAVDRMTSTQLTADYQITTSTYSGLDPKLSAKTAQVPGVTAVAPLRNSAFLLGEDAVNLNGTDLRTIGRVTDLKVVQGSLGAVHGDAVALAKSVADKTGKHTGQSLDVSFFGDKKRHLTVAAVYEDNEIAGDALSDLPLVATPTERPKDDSLLVKTAHGASEATAAQLRAAFGDNPLVKVQDHEDLRRENAGQIGMLVNMVYGLLGMAVVIAVVGVINTLAMSVFERTREIGMLRAIGLARTGIKRMVRLESVVISLFGAVLGIGVGLFLSWAGGSMLASSWKLYETLLPWGRLALFVAIALAVGVLAAVWPARRAAKLNMLEAIGAQ